ncbi:MAG TPA: L-serine ammonia-lyase, partial [Verrucomicrobiales bacterium]|nr:L-serine ammonia-lyase [Verrucomicrobiales bacterium]
MSLSVLDLFTIGIGPSSSHTVGPMRAGFRFVQKLREGGLLDQTARVEGHLYGSLALTGKGHGSDKAVLLGLEGETPEQVDVDGIPAQLERIRTTHHLRLGGEKEIEFAERTGLLFHRLESLPAHPNGLRFNAFDQEGRELLTKTYYSIGGGFVVGEKSAERDELTKDETALPFPFRSGAELMQHCTTTGLSVSSLMLRNEEAFRPEAETRAALLKVWAAMQRCVERGCKNDGTLPGGLKVPRRAPRLYQELSSRPEAALHDSLIALDWVSLWAMAVNEENAVGG